MEKKWINVAKFVAILAVITNHTSNILYTNKNIAIASYFSISLFLLLSGYTMSVSAEKNAGNNVIKRLKKSFMNIVIPYCIATFVYTVAVNHSFSFVEFLNRLIHFNASSPLYYVLLYIQILFVFPIIYDIKMKADNSKHGIIFKALILLILLIFSSWSNNRTDILGVYGGGGVLFGGSYLILLYMGMLIKDWTFIFDKINNFMGLIFFMVCTIGWWQFECFNYFAIDSKLPFGSGINPPSISNITMAFLVYMTLFYFTKTFERYKYTIHIINIMSFLGKNTLYIFLYHRFVLDFILRPYVPLIKNIWITRIFYFLCMILGPMLIKTIVNKIENGIKEVYT
ncbi:MAG: acyltransferase family protein [Lachnospiraceae bacterium]